MFTTMRRHAMTLALFAAFTTAITAIVNMLTEPTISHQAMLQQKMLLDQVVPAELYNSDIQKECYVVTNPALGSSAPHRVFIARQNGEPVAAALESTAPDGYSGAIRLLVGADFHGKVLGVRVTEHHETPGLGDKIEVRISDWITRFTGLMVQGEHDARWAVKKEGGMFDQFTGATITPRAVINSVKRSALYLQTLPSQINTLSACGENQ
ncbi:electron transport complex subunit RsxG [Pectobacterium carotovorum subsp. carotovorum]|uniref:Ion-translocating oxidoreductase complex subunit G n=1 Tax=Pectobacterium versatile TaxID=2488639 RepID=A0AAW3RNS4_9GAMM|nr:MULTISPECIES: electron transport complex subunit RsxG [Pectobacterium]MBA0159023.1 electron transport complex subunit RsxG [Pectobacterium versatile]MCH4996712.1 electron transport complex subunit RsxG [Pectobacterium carotovorum]MCL6336058.1 electron transport complex subunit RsxG [Pectobacterium carotovorum subsp. carotovorum]MCL6349075.1 electron transport complex subunit RsxG [Pectobacterium carotovorum subsp. carotovorum]MCL6403538.1 electron transport complex subunit RsxG [Pectobacter